MKTSALERKILVWLVIASAALLILQGCGSQDYTSSDAHSQDSGSWKALVEAGLTAEPSLKRGRSNDPRLTASSLVETVNCPDESVCVTGIYIGRVQLSKLAQMSDLFAAAEDERSARYEYLGAGVLRLDAEVIDLSPGTELKTCAPITILNAREIRGTGGIDTSGDRCNRDGLRGGDLVLSALQIGALSLRSDGAHREAPGGVDAAHPLRRASDGKSDLVEWKFNWGEAFTGRLCITELACQWDNIEFANEAVKKNRRLLEGSRMVELPKLDVAIASASGFCGGWWCWVSGEKNPEHHKYLFLNWMASLNTMGLQGRDATFYRRGANGVDGGAAGQIRIITLRDEIRSISSKGGVGSEPSNNVCEMPGAGAELSTLIYETHEIESGFSLVCGQKEKDLAGKDSIRICSESRFGSRAKLKFQVGIDKISPTENASVLGSELLNRDGRFFGRDGSIKYTAEEPLRGKDGADSQPRRRISENLAAYAKAFREECAGCALPSSVQAELPSDTSQ